MDPSLPPRTTRLGVHRHDRLGGLLHEYEHADDPEDSAAAREETLGPTVTVIRVRTVEEALERANTLPLGEGEHAAPSPFTIMTFRRTPKQVERVAAIVRRFSAQPAEPA